MGSVGCLAKGDIFFWQNILKNRSKYRGDISEQSVVCTVLISAIIIEIFRKNIPISYIIPYKKLASPLIPVCLRKSHMSFAKAGGIGTCVIAAFPQLLLIMTIFTKVCVKAVEKLAFPQSFVKAGFSAALRKSRLFHRCQYRRLLRSFCEAFL